MLGMRTSSPVLKTGHVSSIAQFDTTLRRSGAYDALAWSNAGTRFRFTCVDRFEPPTLRSVYMVDRANPGILSGGGSQAIDDSYACFVRQMRRPFFTEYSVQDARLGLHPARATIVSYVGVPIYLSDERMWGVLSHYDVTPHAIGDDEPALLQLLADCIGSWLGSREGALMRG